MQWQLHQHALGKVAHRWGEQGAALQAAPMHDFGDMLVRQAQGVHFVRRGLTGLVGLNHGAAAAGVAADRRQAHRGLRRQQTRVNQRAQQRNGPRGVAAWVAHPLRLGDGLGLSGAQLGKTIHPPLGGAMCRGGVDHPGGGLPLIAQRLHLGHAGAGVVVVQAQNGHVGLGEQRLFGLRVFALSRVDGEQRETGQVLQALPYVQPGGAGLAVNEYPHARSLGTSAAACWAQRGRGRQQNANKVMIQSGSTLVRKRMCVVAA